MLKYRPFEMHCHTRHSDGTFLVPQLIESVAAYGYAGLALTDHNRTAGGHGGTAAEKQLSGAARY